jgi:uncharacterized protein with HEPN domain
MTSLLDDDRIARLTHHYFEVDLDLLWSTVTESLPALLAALPSPGS